MLDHSKLRELMLLGYYMRGAFIRVRTRALAHTHTHTRTHARTHTHTHSHTHTHTHQVLFEQFKFFLNLYFLVIALTQFIPVLRIGYLYTYWGPLVRRV